MRVAPHVGAWIETEIKKLLSCRLFVAPHVGAWIETDFISFNRMFYNIVAPHVGAWIETLTLTKSLPRDSSRPTWARGLKHVLDLSCTCKWCVAPHVGAWIETDIVRVEYHMIHQSRPTWARGLKQEQIAFQMQS